MRNQIARKVWQHDQKLALDTLRKIKESDPSFCPSEGPASPHFYRFAYRTLGFRVIFIKQLYQFGILAFIKLTSIRIWLRAHESAPVFIYLPCFTLGFVAFLRVGKLLDIVPFAATVLGFGLLTWLNLGPLPAIAAVATVVLIFLPIKKPVPILSLLGTISYSLYLVHASIGDRIINLTTRLLAIWWLQTLGLTLAIGASRSAAYLLWRLVEKPSTRLAKDISNIARPAVSVRSQRVAD